MFVPDNEDLRRIMEERERGSSSPVFECEECGSGIYDGEEYLDLRDMFCGCLCSECAGKLWKTALGGGEE